MPEVSTSSGQTSPGDAHVFATTCWSVVAAAGLAGTSESHAALEVLCRTYWYPLYAYVRRLGHGPEDAQDLTQSFFIRFIEKDYLAQAAPEKGRFRSFLLTSLKHFIWDEHDKARAQKRGGRIQPISLDGITAEELYQLEPPNMPSAEKLFERRWAITVLERAASRVRAQYFAEGKGRLYDELKGFLAADQAPPSYAEVAARLALTESAVKSAIHRLRQRHREFIREEVAQTVATAAEIDQEIHCLIQALTQG